MPIEQSDEYLAALIQRVIPYSEVQENALKAGLNDEFLKRKACEQYNRIWQAAQSLVNEHSQKQREGERLTEKAKEDIPQGSRLGRALESAAL